MSQFLMHTRGPCSLRPGHFVPFSQQRRDSLHTSPILPVVFSLQEATVPLFAGNKDVAVDAQTGSGKTLAFVLPVVERLRRLEEPLKKHQVGCFGGRWVGWVGVGEWFGLRLGWCPLPPAGPPDPDCGAPRP